MDFRIIVITGLRIDALNMVNSTDITYSKGYLGLLSEAGAFVGITTCSTGFLISLYNGANCMHASIREARLWTGLKAVLQSNEKSLDKANISHPMNDLYGRDKVLEDHAAAFEAKVITRERKANAAGITSGAGRSLDLRRSSSTNKHTFLARRNTI